MLEELYGREPLPFQTLNFKLGTQQAAHSDALHFNSMPAGFMCGVWVALEDIDMDNGPLVYYPGSHKLPELTMQDIGAEAREDEYPKYEQYIRRVIEREGLEARLRHDPKGPGADLGVQPAARRRSAARHGPDAQEPGDALLLQGLPVLHADAQRPSPRHAGAIPTGSRDTRARGGRGAQLKR